MKPLALLIARTAPTVGPGGAVARPLPWRPPPQILQYTLAPWAALGRSPVLTSHHTPIRPDVLQAILRHFADFGKVNPNQQGDM